LWFKSKLSEAIAVNLAWLAKALYGLVEEGQLLLFVGRLSSQWQINEIKLSFFAGNVSLWNTSLICNLPESKAHSSVDVSLSH